ncbi:MAG: hypothetical protein ACRYGP_02575 [Janthinobacterium lividum]
MHGTFKPREPERRHTAQGGVLQLIVRILLREVAVGCPLYLLLGHDPVLNVTVCTMAFAVLLALTNRYGLLRHRTRLDVFTECFVILMGGLAFRNVLTIAPTLFGVH